MLSIIARGMWDMSNTEKESDTYENATSCRSCKSEKLKFKISNSVQCRNTLGGRVDIFVCDKSIICKLLLCVKICEWSLFILVFEQFKYISLLFWKYKCSCNWNIGLFEMSMCLKAFKCANVCKLICKIALLLMSKWER